MALLYSLCSLCFLASNTTQSAFPPPSWLDMVPMESFRCCSCPENLLCFSETIKHCCYHYHHHHHHPLLSLSLLLYLAALSPCIHGAWDVHARRVKTNAIKLQKDNAAFLSSIVLYVCCLVSSNVELKHVIWMLGYTPLSKENKVYEETISLRPWFMSVRMVLLRNAQKLIKAELNIELFIIHLTLKTNG